MMQNMQHPLTRMINVRRFPGSNPGHSTKNEITENLETMFDITYTEEEVVELKDKFRNVEIAGKRIKDLESVMCDFNSNVRYHKHNDKDLSRIALDFSKKFTQLLRNR